MNVILKKHRVAVPGVVVAVEQGRSKEEVDILRKRSYFW